MIRVLLVDDEPLALEYIRHLVDWGKLGFEIVATANNGKQALQLYQKYMPDIIISDIKMPIMGGLDLASQVVENSSAIIIFLTAYEDPEYTIGAVNNGVCRYWLKHTLDPRSLAKNLEELRIIVARRKKDLIYKSRSQLVEIMLEGETEDNLIPLFQNLDIPVKGYAYFVCALRLDRPPEKEPHRLLAEILAEKFSNKAVFLRFGYNCYGVLVCLPSRPSRMEQHSELFKLLKDYSNDFNIKSGQSLSIGVSGSAISPKEVSRLYSTAFDCLGSSFFTGPGSILDTPATKFANPDILNLDETSEIIKQMLIERSPVILTAYLQDHIKLCGNETEARKLFSVTQEALTIEMHKIKSDRIAAYNWSSLWHLIRAANFAHEALGYFDEAARKLIEFCSCGQSLQYSYHVTAAIRYVEQNYNKNIGLDNIEEHLGIKKEYFCNCFKKETGKRFVEYLTEYRITKVCDLLENTNNKLYEIASETGFSNSYYLSLIFKKITGSSPSDYRNAHSKR